MSYTGQIPDTLTRPQDWRADTPCKADPDAMFPGTNKHEIDRAKSFCHACPVTQQCLQWALETGEEYGVYGGLTEQERRAMRRRAERPISIDDYAGTRPTRQRARTFQESWELGTLPDGEHLLWVGPKVINQPRPAPQITPNRLSFFLDRGRWPEGDCKRMCAAEGCVKPSHLTDRRERAEEADLAVAV